MKKAKPFGAKESKREERAEKSMSAAKYKAGEKREGAKSTSGKRK